LLGVVTRIYTSPFLFLQSKNTHFSPLELRFSSIKKTKSKAHLHALTRYGYTTNHIILLLSIGHPLVIKAPS